MDKIIKYLKKEWSTVLMGGFVLLMLFSTSSRSWVLRQVMHTGIFNARVKEAKPMPEGVSAYNFKFQDENGQIIDLESLKGKVIFINFWASWCPPCIAEFPAIEEFRHQFKDDPDIYIMMINEDSKPNAAENFLTKNEYSTPIHKLVTRAPTDLYAGKLPTTVLLDKNGRIRMHKEGVGNYNTKKFYKQVEELIAEDI